MKIYREENDLNAMDRLLSAFYYKPAYMESAFAKMERTFPEIGS